MAWLSFIFVNVIYRSPNYQAIPGVDVKEWLNYLKSLEGNFDVIQ